jgi:hypothetical protein
MTRKQILFGNMKEEEQKIKDIDNLITILNKYFPNFTKDAILESLKQNSFDIYDTYFFLSSPFTFKGK